MGIDTKEKILSGSVSIHKKSYSMIPVESGSNLGLGIGNSVGDSQKEKISGSKSISGILVNDPRNLLVRTDSGLGSASGLIQQLALGCLYLMTGNAHAEFPGSTTAHPSSIVRIDLSTKDSFVNQPQKSLMTPLDLKRELWEDVMVPVMEDISVSPDLPINQQSLFANDSSYLVKLEELLILKLQEKGYYRP